MSEAELLGRAAAYLTSFLALGFGSWAIAAAALPEPARAGLRLLAGILGQFLLTALLVQSLGLAGLLTAPIYFAAALAIGAGALVFLRRRPGRPWRGPARALLVLVAAPSRGLGWLGGLLLFFLASQLLALPHDIDALSLHGPLIVEWVQAGRVTLESHWNYPQAWEYQQAPVFLLLGSDLLVAIPALLAVAALFLAVRELASRLRLPGHAAYLLALLAATVAAAWRDPFKNDPLFAAALLTGLLAVERTARGRGGAFWLLQLALFLVLGTKPSGFLYAGALLALYLVGRYLPAPARAGLAPGRKSGLLAGVPMVVGAAVLQAAAAAVQLHNLAAHRNPVFPVSFQVAGHEFSPGPTDLSGTSILDHFGQLETWRQWLAGGSLTIGPEWPFLILLLAASLALSWARLPGLFRRSSFGGQAQILLPFLAVTLWALFAATPWSCGLGPGSWDYLANGSSLRYALAPIALTYLATGLVLQRWLGARAATLVLAVATPGLIFRKWQVMGFWNGRETFLAVVPIVFVLALFMGRRPFQWLRGWLRPLSGASPGRRLGIALALLAGAILPLFLLASHLQATRNGSWLPAYRSLWTEAWRAPAGAKVATNLPRPLYRYLLYGRAFDHRLIAVEVGKGRGGTIPDDVSLIYLVPRSGGASLDELLANLEPRGWQLVVQSEQGEAALLARMP